MGLLQNDDIYRNDLSRRAANPWVKLSASEWELLTADLYPIRFEKNTIIYRQDEMLHFAFIVKSGRVRISYYSEGGEEKGILIAEENCMFGEAAVLPEYPTYYTATAIVDSELYLIPRARLLDAIREDPDFSVRLIMLMARKMRIYSAQEIELSFSEAYARTCRVFLYIADVYGKKTEDGILIENRFTHQELANMIHVSRVSVANVFSELTRNGIIEKRGGYYLILRLEDLYIYA